MYDRMEYNRAVCHGCRHIPFCLLGLLQTKSDRISKIHCLENESTLHWPTSEKTGPENRSNVHTELTSMFARHSYSPPKHKSLQLLRQWVSFCIGYFTAMSTAQKGTNVVVIYDLFHGTVHKAIKCQVWRGCLRHSKSQSGRVLPQA